MIGKSINLHSGKGESKLNQGRWHFGADGISELVDGFGELGQGDNPQ